MRRDARACMLYIVYMLHMLYTVGPWWTAVHGGNMVDMLYTVYVVYSP
jgi:hypothetical protein